jgi:hypothetical protein
MAVPVAIGISAEDSDICSTKVNKAKVQNNG